VSRPTCWSEALSRQVAGELSTNSPEPGDTVHSPHQGRCGAEGAVLDLMFDGSTLRVSRTCSGSAGRAPLRQALPGVTVSIRSCL
jgi:hypothetical protein